MKISNKKLLAEFRTSGLCGYCGKNCKVREPAHLISKGSGGSDLRCNLIALGSTLIMECRCHSTSHNANSGNQQHPNPKDLLKKVAQREKVSPEQIRAIVWFIGNRLDKHDSRERIEEKIDNWEAGQMVKWIVRRELVEAGKI